MPFTADEIESIRSDCFANDVAYDVETFANLTEDELIAYFESGGEDLPAGVPKPKPLPKPKSKPKPNGTDAVKAYEKPPASAENPAEPDEADLPEERPTTRGLLCLHAMAHCGQIMQKQLRPLGLEAAGARLGPMRFLDGTVAIDTSAHPEAKRLKAFYPSFPNLAYLELYEQHKTSRAERAYVLKPEDKKERPLNPPSLNQPPGYVNPCAISAHATRSVASRKRRLRHRRPTTDALASRLARAGLKRPGPPRLGSSVTASCSPLSHGSPESWPTRRRAPRWPTSAWSPSAKVPTCSRCCWRSSTRQSWRRRPTRRFAPGATRARRTTRTWPIG